MGATKGDETRLTDCEEIPLDMAWAPRSTEVIDSDGRRPEKEHETCGN